MALFAGTLSVVAAVLGAPAVCAGADSGAAAGDRAQQMADVWAGVYHSLGVQVVSPAKAPAAAPAPGPERWTNLADHVDAQLNTAYQFNAASFSGEPTVSCITAGGTSGPCATVPADAGIPQPTTSPYPPAFDGSDHRFYGYGAIGTTGFGNPRLNTYLSGFFNNDFSATPGSPFFSSLNAYGGDKQQLVNAYAEMRGFAPSGVLADASARLGRVFVPFSFPGLVGSTAIDGGRLAYDDGRTAASAFAGHWDPLYGSLDSEAFVVGGSISRQLFPKAGPHAGLTPYVQYLFLNDNVNGHTSSRHIYGVRGWYDTLLINAYFSWINANPIDLGLEASYAPGRFSFYAHVLKKLTADDYSYDIFSNDDDLRGRQFLNLGAVNRWTDIIVDGGYQVCRWANVGTQVWVRALDNQNDSGPYDESFQEVAPRVLITPHGPLSGSVQYRYRGVRRGSPVTTTFDDITNAGETQYQEVNPEIGYRFKDRFQAQVGGYWGRYNFQDRLRQIDGTTAAGGYLRTRTNLTTHLAFRLLFLVDRGNDEFTPDINLQYVVRSALELSY